MKNTLFIKQGRILLQQAAQKQNRLSLKICVGTDIYKFKNLIWSQPCNRWEINQQIKIGYLKGLPIQLQLYYPSKSIPKVVGQAVIDMNIFSKHLEEELKIALTYNGMIKGWLYCQIGIQGQGPLKIQSKYLYIHKLSFHFLEDSEQQFDLSIFQNTRPIYQKKFILNQTSKTLFPNIKNMIKYSDVVRITLLGDQQKFKDISFLTDNIKRGKTANYETWLRNKFNNKAGDVKIQYFLQNLFIENDRKVLSRKAIFPKGLSRASNLINEQALLQIQKQVQKIEEEKSENESTNLSSQDLNISQVKSFKLKRKQIKCITKNDGNDTKNENAMPCLKLKSSKSLKKLTKKQDFYFKHPFE